MRRTAIAAAWLLGATVPVLASGVLVLGAVALAGCAGTQTKGSGSMDHGAMAGMDHAAMPGDASDAPAHDMAGMSHASMPGMQHGAPSAAVEPAPPVTNASIAATQPAATLRTDAFDAPAPASVGEAARAATGMTHAIEETPVQHEAPQKPPAEHHHHDR